MSHDGLMPGAGVALRGWMVLTLLLGFFGVVAGANAVMVHYAIATFRGEQEASPYEHGIAYEKDIEAARAQEALRWTVSAALSRDKEGMALVEVTVTDASQMPVRGLGFTSALVSPTDKNRDKQLSLAETAPGVYSGRVAATPGQWDLLLEVRHDSARVFRSKNRVALR
jgi:nitrogen fixation protein FixH